jgi:hypothetical protein
MAANLGLVAHAAQRDAHELAPSDCAIDRASEVLPTPGADEDRDRALDVGLSLRTARYSRMRSLAFSSPNDRRRATAFVRGRSMTSSVRFCHGSVDEPVEIGARHRVFGRRHRHLRQPIELALRFLLDLLRHAGGSIFSLQLLDLLRLVVALASSFWIAFSCSRRKYSRWFLPTPTAPATGSSSRARDLELLDQDAVERVHPRAHVERFEHFLLHRVAMVVRLEAMKSARRPAR